MMSQKARYALKAALTLAASEAGRPVLIAQIAERGQVPRKFLEQILLDLKRAGLVVSRRGKHGGYTLGRPPDAITFAEILRVIDGPLAHLPCASRTAFQACADCPDAPGCAVRHVLTRARDATAAVLEATSLAQALARPDPQPAERAAA